MYHVEEIDVFAISGTLWMCFFCIKHLSIMLMGMYREFHEYLWLVQIEILIDKHFPTSLKCIFLINKIDILWRANRALNNGK